MNKTLLILLLILLISCSRELPFDKEKWNKKEDTFFNHRREIVSDLATNHLNSKMTRKEIIDLIGEPTFKDGLIIEKGEFGYEIYKDYGWDIDPVEVQYLTISFDKDSTLDRIFLKTWKQHKGIRVKELTTK